MQNLAISGTLHLPESLMKGGLYILFASMFIVMSGYGLTLPVLPFFIERMALGNGATSEEISVHVGALTGVLALMQFFFAPLWAFNALPPVSANSPGLSRGGFYSFGRSTHRIYITAVPMLAAAIFLEAKVFRERGRQDGPHFDWGVCKVKNCLAPSEGFQEDSTGKPATALKLEGNP